MSERIDRDREVRREVGQRLDVTYLLDAGAGSGKTTVLVDRYVSCVLRGTRGDVARVAAITFTEKAAGELRQRIREKLEKLAAETEPGSDEARRVAAARDGLDDAPISTIHSFAGRLLREHPVEARVDPAFEQMDALRAGIELARLWEDWLSLLAGAGVGDDATAAGPDSDPVAGVRARLARLLRAGVKLGDLRDLAAGQGGVFTERYDIDLGRPAPSEPDLAAGVASLVEPAGRLARYCARACSDPDADAGYAAATALVAGCERLAADPPDDVDRCAAALYALPVRTTKTAPGGRTSNWISDEGGVAGLQNRYAALVAAIASLRSDYAAYLSGLAVSVASRFAEWASAELLRLGRLDFADLLGRLRDLLRDDLPTRAVLRRRFDYVLVDEFQDTDPLQAEIVFFLCERADVAAPAARWDEVLLQPGKLFVVGDPKQSIYRFRRADIRLYSRVAQLIGGQPGDSGRVCSLLRNFRTTPEVVGWVNDAFDDVFESDYAEGRQPHYTAVEPERSSIGGPGVVVVRPVSADRFQRRVGAARAAEAEAVAGLLREMCDPESRESWRVDDDGALRRPRYSDVALLYRTSTGLETYEQALREAGVPYVVDGSTAYFSRREVDDALLCLRAVDDPSDGPAVYGALHSTFFGFSDDDLFLFWSDGGRFDPFAGGQPAGHDAVAGALGLLARLHRRRAECEPHELVTELLRLVHASEFLAATGSGSRQAIANLEKLVDQARAHAAAGGGGLGEFLAWAAEAGGSAGEAESPVDDESEAVHLFTIHKAKGLERPIVVLIGGSLQGRSGGRWGKVEPIVDRNDRSVAVKLKVELAGVGPCDLVSPAYQRAKADEDAMAASEARRLLYVALTRARDHLVIPHFGALTTQGGAPSAVLLAPAGGSLPEVREFDEPYEQRGVRVVPPPRLPARAEPRVATSVEAVLAERARWAEERALLLAEASRPARATSPSGLERLDDDVRAGGPGVPAGRAAALALGVAVHRVMEVCDLADAASVARVARDVSRGLGRPDLASEVAALAGACWSAAPVRTAASAAGDAGAVWRELPVGMLVDDVVVTGAVDLVYLHEGHWVVVDYKTDRVGDAGELGERYAPQGAAYALAVETATGIPVREVVFVAARARLGAVDPWAGVLRMPFDGALRDHVALDVAAAVGEGRAIVVDL